MGRPYHPAPAFAFDLSSRALTATMMVESDMRTAPIAGLRIIPTGASTPAAAGMAI